MNKQFTKHQILALLDAASKVENPSHPLVNAVAKLRHALRGREIMEERSNAYRRGLTAQESK